MLFHQLQILFPIIPPKSRPLQFPDLFVNLEAWGWQEQLRRKTLAILKKIPSQHLRHHCSLERQMWQYARAWEPPRPYFARGKNARYQCPLAAMKEGITWVITALNEIIGFAACWINHTTHFWLHNLNSSSYTLQEEEYRLHGLHSGYMDCTHLAVCTSSSLQSFHIIYLIDFDLKGLPQPPLPTSQGPVNPANRRAVGRLPCWGSGIKW